MRLNSIDIEAYQSDHIAQVFETHGFNQSSLDEFDLPELQLASDTTGRIEIPYVSVGVEDAPNVHVIATPMFTRLTPHFLLRLMAKQAVLGEDARVLGVEAYNPESFKYDAASKKQLAGGSFAPLSGRMIDAALSAGVRDEQKVTLEGYSLGADIAIQTAHDTLFNESRGALNVVRLGATEAARSSDRNPIAMLKAFGDSGKNMGENIVASGVPALVEAWEVDPAYAFSNRANKLFEKVATGGVIKYVRASGTANLALLRGFATDTSTRQLLDITERSELYAYVSRTEDSTVFPVADFEAFEYDTSASWRTITGVEQGDHSSDDDIRLSAARSLFLARVI